MSHVYYQPIISPARDARNGHYPATSFYGRLQLAHNHLVGFRHKTVFQRQARLGNKSFGYSGTTNLARFRFRSGYFPGSYCTGLFGIAARLAASASVSCASLMPRARASRASPVMPGMR